MRATLQNVHVARTASLLPRLMLLLMPLAAAACAAAATPTPTLTLGPSLTSAEIIGLVESYLESKSYEGTTKVLVDREVPCTQLEVDLAEWGYPLIEPSCKTEGTRLELVPLEAPVVLPCSDTIQGPLTAQYPPAEGVWEVSAQAVWIRVNRWRGR